MKRISRFMVAASLVAMTAGCTGDDGTNGTNGTNGTDGADGEACTVTDNDDGTYTITCGDDETIVSDGMDGVDGDGCTAVDNQDGTFTITCGEDEIIVSDGTDVTTTKTLTNLDVAITRVFNNGGALAVTFTVADNGNPVTNLTMDPIRIYMVQRQPAAESYDLDTWSDRTLYERSSTAGADDRLVQAPLGTYTYTFLETIQEAIDNDGADASLVSQVSLRIRRFESYNTVNAIYQVTGLPTTDGADATEVAAQVGQIVNSAACDSCHDPLAMHGGGYVRVEFCVMCHTRATQDRVDNRTDLMTMVHQIHAGIDATAGCAGDCVDWSHVGYPQPVNNCRKCHSATGADANNWETKPTIEACGSCHAVGGTWDPSTHMGNQTTSANCGNSGCHGDAGAIAQAHATEFVTPLNPETPTGAGSATASNFEYVLNSATASGDDVTVNFQVLKDGTALDLLGTYPPTGFSGGPNFRLAYALPQDGIDEPADWNNRGENKAQPIGQNLGDLITATEVTEGTVTDTYDVTFSFPTGATLRAVAMDGYFTQVDFFAAGSNLARHAVSAVIPVDGDEERRAILNVTGCLDCHERLELHGGNRVLAAETDDNVTAVCITCHNPNLSSSGNTFDYADFLANPGDYNSSSVATVATYGTDPFAWPEATQNFKDLVHGIHAAHDRAYPYEHVRVRSGNAYSYDWSHVTFPGDASNCAKCHKSDSYMPDEIPATALMSTNITGTPVNRTEALAVRDTVPNADDQVIRPAVAACFSCHNSDLAVAHMNQNGGALGMDRNVIGGESAATCVLCHGAGRVGDVSLMHPGLNR